MLGAFGLFFWRLILAAVASTNNFSRLLIAGFALMVFAQMAINVGMNLGLLPVTGISLPFLSSGGSNLLVNFVALGIVQNIIAQSKESVRLGEEEQ
jgi:cell division protein FtsW (lipid II flippase)